MAINRVQFQRGLSMSEFQSKYGVEAQCEKALAKARWPNGFECPKCKETKHCVFERDARTYWQCQRCHQQVTVTAGTIFQATKLPLTSWFLAMHLLTQAKNNISALALMRHLGVSYRTAWAVKHKLLQVMGLQEEHRVLSGQVEVLETAIGGRRSGKRRSAASKPVVVAVQKREDGRPQLIRVSLMPLNDRTVSAWAAKALAQSAWVQPGTQPYHEALPRETDAHRANESEAFLVGSHQREKRCANSLLRNFTAAMSGTYHAIDLGKYGHRYIAEAQYRFNRRFDLKSILGELICDAVSTRPHKEFLLRAA